MSNKNLESCGLCGKVAPLTFEHVPPRCAFNNKQIHIQNHEHLLESNSPLFGKRKRSNLGFGKWSLCASCNNNTGSWYAKAFCEFAQQGMRILKNNKTPYFIKAEYTIKPHNVLKQILTMFLTADTAHIIRDFPGVKEYLLERNNQDFPPDLDVYLYSNASSLKRLLGYHVVGNVNGRISNWAEINFQPFGYLLAHKSDPPNQYMLKINKFNQATYDETRKVMLTTMYLKVDTPEIGLYSNLPSP